jgi:hypothetical protein
MQRGLDQLAASANAFSGNKWNNWLLVHLFHCNTSPNQGIAAQALLLLQLLHLELACRNEISAGQISRSQQ